MEKTKQTNVNDKPKSPPETKFSAGAVSVAVWANYNKLDDGTMKEFKSVTPQKTYKDADDFKHSNTYGLNDIPKLIYCLQQAYEYLLKKKEDE